MAKRNEQYTRRINRLKALLWCWWNESGNPLSEVWREYLTHTEREMVQRWDEAMDTNRTLEDALYMAYKKLV